CVLWELQAKEIQVQELLPGKLQFTILSLQIPDEPKISGGFCLRLFYLEFFIISPASDFSLSNVNTLYMTMAFFYHVFALNI
uniref:hypothetical protein n=1 Tax=Prevotella sp. TaxID=59823 RepID=UPI004027C82F